MSDLDLAAIREKLRKVDVLSGIMGSAAQADLDAICEDLAFNDVADLLAEVDRLRAENAAMRKVVEELQMWRDPHGVEWGNLSGWGEDMVDHYDAVQGEKA